jgi:hypothetical protein
MRRLLIVHRACLGRGRLRNAAEVWSSRSGAPGWRSGGLSCIGCPLEKGAKFRQYDHTVNTSDKVGASRKNLKEDDQRLRI